MHSRYRARNEERNNTMSVVAVYQKEKVGQYISYVAREGDSFEKLANKYLGGPIFFWRIAELNPHVPFPDQIPIGTKIRIPR